MTTLEEARRLAQIAAEAAESTGGIDLVALDVSAPLPFSDVFLIVSGRSERNVLAIAREIEDRLTSAGVHAARREGLEDGRWVLLDYAGLVVHVFVEEERMFYGLERLWKDCPVVPLELPASQTSR